MPKPASELNILNGDTLVLGYTYKTSRRPHNFSFCYTVGLPNASTISLKVQDKKLITRLNQTFIMGCLRDYFSGDTSFGDVEMTIFSKKEMSFRDRYPIRPLVVGLAKKDTTAYTVGTYSAFFRKIQEGYPVLQLGRFRMFDFFLPTATTDQEVILENKLFKNTLYLEVENIAGTTETVALDFFGITPLRPINLGEEGVFMEEKITP